MMSPEKIAYIRTLADENGHIEPADVIEAARDPANPLHDEFEWDTAAAARQHWLDHARRLIRLVKVEFKVENKTYRAVAYVSDPEREPKSRRYVDLTIAAQQRSTAHAILMAEMDRITSAIRRAQEIAMVLGLTKELDALLADVSSIRAMAQERTTKRKKLTKKRTARAPAPRRKGSHAEVRV